MADNYDEVVGEILMERRQTLGLSQAEVGEVVDVTGATVSNWERGISRIPHTMFMRVSLQVFDEHPSELMRQVEQRLLGDADTY